VTGREKAKRRRKRRLANPAPTPAEPVAAVTAESPSKNDIAREQLVPLEEGERPLAVTIGAVVASLLVGTYVVAFLVSDANVAAGAPFVVVLAIAAIGMWRSRYWAVLGFQVLLAITLVNALLFLIVRADTPVGIAGGLLITLGGGALFWFLVKAMARLQMPERRSRAGGR
jgi:hypothetical protein